MLFLFFYCPCPFVCLKKCPFVLLQFEIENFMLIDVLLYICVIFKSFFIFHGLLQSASGVYEPYTTQCRLASLTTLFMAMKTRQ